MIWLPTEILEEILCYLDYQTLKQCCLVNNTWYHVIISLNSVWLEMCRKNNIKLGLDHDSVMSNCHVTPSGHVTSESENVLNSAEFYREKIRLLARRCREFNMKGYPFDEELEPLDVRFMSSNSSYIVLILAGNELVCIDNISWNVAVKSQLRYSDEVVFLECTDTFLVSGHVSGRVTVYEITSRDVLMTSRDSFGASEIPVKVLNVSSDFQTRLAGVKCVKIHDNSKTLAMICNSDMTVFHNGRLIYEVADLNSFNWSKLLWDGKSPKDGIYQNLFNFVSEDQVVAVSPKKLYLLTIGCSNPSSIKIVDIQDDHTNCLLHKTSQKCYFWPSVVISDKYICCRTSCSVKLYHKRTNKQTLVLYKVFPKFYSPNERLVFPSERVNLIGIGSKFLVTVDTHVFPRVLIFDVESGKLVSIIGDDRNECESQISIYHGIYHMSYFVNIPSRAWLDGDFRDDPRPCLITYKHKDYLSDNVLWLFQLEKFRVRADKPQEFFGQCSKVTTLEVRRKLKGTDNVIPVQV